MSVEVVRRAFELWSEGTEADDELLREFAHPDIELDMTTNVFNPARYEGYDGFRAFNRQVSEVWSRFRMDPVELLEAGDDVVAILHARGLGRTSGVEVDAMVAAVCRLRDGLIASVRIEPDVEAARRLAGGPAP
jgi:ketosteroid isomerase-like protein